MNMTLWRTLLPLLLLDICVSTLHPIILVPGFGASVLEVRYNKPEKVHFYCSKSSHNKWVRLWIPNPTDLLPKVVDCWSDNIRLRYNSTHTAKNSPGVEIRPSGSLDLIPDLPSANVYLTLQNHFGTSLTPAAYDFRLSPISNSQFLTDLQYLIESAYIKAGNQSVVLLTHSLGALWCHYFLTSQPAITSAWKDRYIHAWVPISPAYGGAVLDMLQLLTGAAPSWLSGRDLREEQRSYETSLWLLPAKQLYGNHALVTLNGVKYTANDYQKLFADAGFRSFGERWQQVENLTRWENQSPHHRAKQRLMLADPKVRVHLIHGTNIATPIRYDYQDSFDHDPFHVETSLDGDGTLGFTSLQAGNHWSHSSTPLVLDGMSHTNILSDPRTISHIEEIANRAIALDFSQLPQIQSPT